MNAVIDEIYREERVVLADGRQVNPFPVAIKRAEGEMLYRLVRAVRPAATLEVGMAWGLSAMFICQALKDNGGGRHTAIDPFQGKFHYAGVGNVQKAGLGGYLRFIEKSSQLALPGLVEAGEKFEVVFVDGGHLFDLAFVDFFFVDLLLPVGGYVVFDDLWMPAVRKVLRFILRNKRYAIAEEQMGDRGPFVQRHLQNLRYQAKKRMKGRRSLGTGSEMDFHGGRNVNWCVLRKAGEEEREWDHFAGF
jgi:predicted O-methyltransferase YrrM